MRHLSTSAAPRPVGAYSQGVETDGFVVTAGMGPIDPATGAVVGDTIAEQTHRTLDNLEAVLRESGLTLADVVKATVHLQHLERDFAAYDAVCRERFSEPYPARTTVGSQLLGILVEIDVLAVRKHR